MRSADSLERVATLIEQLTRRLDCAHEIALDARARLAHADAAEIETSTARLETVAQEFKLLVEEYQRLSDEDIAASPGAARARRDLDRSIARLARSSAISGGLLERMILISRRRLDLLNSATEGTYRANGRVSEFDARGLRLKERV